MLCPRVYVRATFASVYNTIVAIGTYSTSYGPCGKWRFVGYAEFVCIPFDTYMVYIVCISDSYLCRCAVIISVGYKV